MRILVISILIDSHIQLVSYQQHQKTQKYQHYVDSVDIYPRSDADTVGYLLFLQETEETTRGPN